MPCNSARADVLKKGKLNAFVHFWNSGEHVWYLFVFILDWMYSLLFKVNFLKPHCFSVILFLLFPTTHIWSLNRFLAFPPPIFGLQLVTIGKESVWCCMFPMFPFCSSAPSRIWQEGTRLLQRTPLTIHECQIHIPTDCHPHFSWFSLCPNLS